MIANRIKELRIASHMTQKELAVSLNRTQQAIGKWEKGLAEPDASCILSLAEIFSVSTDYLLGRVDTLGITSSKEENIALPERTMLGLFRKLNTEGQEKLLGYADDLVTSGKYIKTDSIGLVQGA